MSMKQLVETRNELRSALARVQRLIEVQVEAEAKVARAKRAERKARNPKVPVDPTHDPRVAAIREVVYDYFGRTTQIFNNRRKSGARSVKVWYAMSACQIEAIKARIDAVVTVDAYELVSPSFPRETDKRFLRIVLAPAN